jgi:Siphovirus Gp157
MTLFAISQSIQQLYDAVDDSGELDAELAKLADDLMTEQSTKLTSYANLISQLEMEESACKAQIEQWQKKGQARANLRDRLKKRIKEHLEFTSQSKAETTDGRMVKIVTNGGNLPLIIEPETDPVQIPEEFRETIIMFNKKAIADKLKSGETLEWAKLGELGTHLRIS